MAKELNYSADLQIDPDALDVELLKQPGLFMKYCEISAQAKLNLDRVKENLDVLRSEMRLDIAGNPEKFGLVKVTEAAIDAVITIRPEYKDAQLRVAEAKQQADLAVSAVRAFEMKKESLQDLVRLCVAGYFATPSVPRNLNLEAAKAGLHEQAVQTMKRRTT